MYARAAGDRSRQWNVSYGNVGWAVNERVDIAPMAAV
jgi:hypothetical protein